MTKASTLLNKKSKDVPDRTVMQGLVAMFQAGRLDEAESHARTLTLRYPSHPFAWAMLGAVLRSQKRNVDALEPIQTAGALSPSDPQLRFNLGNLLRDLGQLEQAADSYLQALALRPQFPQAHYQLGNIQHDLRQLESAERSYRQALLYNPGDARIHGNLALLLQDMGRWGDALSSYQSALTLEPENPVLHYNFADLLHDLGRFHEARLACERALQLKPDLAPAHSNMGAILADLGETEAAISSYRRAIELQPDDLVTRSSLLFCLNYLPDQDPEVCFNEAVRFGQMVNTKGAPPFSHWTCDDGPKRLRVGLVSGDLREHPVGHFLEGVLSHMDTASIDLLAFPTQQHADDLTARIHPRFSAWLPLTGLDDQHAASLIHEQGVHVLLDLSGHTAHNRLPIFGLRPAPVQATWLGYFATTGLAQMDYLVADPDTLLPSEEGAFTEKIWRLPRTRLCFTPPGVPIEVNLLPAAELGHVTFGCFNNIRKVTDDVVELWSGILDAVPSSRLLLKAKQLGDLEVQNSLRSRFARHGLSSERVLLEGPTSRPDYLAAYQRVDIGLDPFPFPGGTTTAESLWMGVPVLTLAGKRFLSRQGVGLLTQAGLSDWVASSADDYLERAVRHASDLPKLARLRQGLRAQVLNSPVFDSAMFARDFEAALHGMWRERAITKVIDASSVSV